MIAACGRFNGHHPELTPPVFEPRRAEIAKGRMAPLRIVEDCVDLYQRAGLVSLEIAQQASGAARLGGLAADGRASAPASRPPRPTRQFVMPTVALVEIAKL